VKTALSIVFVVVAIALAIIVLMQEGKSQGLSGTLGGGSETYWSKNKGRSKDAVMVKITIVLTVIFFVLAILLSSKWL
jgi:preprotein translocase subunit SecG